MFFLGWVALGLKIPLSPGRMRDMLMDFGNKVRTEIKIDLAKRVKSAERFSLSVDEWTSTRNMRYMAFELQTRDKEKFNLGLKVIDGALPAETAARMIERVFSEYELVVKIHIVCLITDGAPVMKKCARVLGISNQVCVAHGIHLAVSALYKKKTTPDQDQQTATNRDRPTD